MPIKFNHVILNRPGEQSPPYFPAYSFTHIFAKHSRTLKILTTNADDDVPSYRSFQKEKEEREERKLETGFFASKSAIIGAFSRDSHVHYNL